jgi:hypothetical protein
MGREGGREGGKEMGEDPFIKFHAFGNRHDMGGLLLLK